MLRWIICGIAAGTISWLPFSSAGLTAAVSINSNFYSPGTTNINVNDQVKWTWVSGFHSTTSDAGPSPLWDSGAMGSGTYTFAFTTAGTFPYHCLVHGLSMAGSIVVQAAANVPPTVTITNPASGAIFSEPATITIRASASDSDGSVTNVQFRQGAAVLANRTSSPYSVTVSNLAAGSHTFSAIASDNAGAKATNSISVTVVTPVAITLSAAQRLSSTGFQLSYSANVGLRYVVERSSTLPNWVALKTNTAGSNPVVFVDGSTSASAGFYRVGRLPNP